ncbi:hypothetical protein ABPG72_002406 [Tetrahymena utriculariae]
MNSNNQDENSLKQKLASIIQNKRRIKQIYTEKGIQMITKPELVLKTEAEYPNFGISGSCYTTNSTITKFKLVSYESLPETTEVLKIALNHSPFSISLDATYLGDYVSGVFNCKNQKIEINHAVLAVGYDEQGNWILKNSWADDWGQQGNFLLAPDNACGILETGVEITA